MDAKFKLAKDVGRLRESVKFFSKNTCTPAHIEYPIGLSCKHVKHNITQIQFKKKVISVTLTWWHGRC